MLVVLVNSEIKLSLPDEKIRAGFGQSIKVCSPSFARTLIEAEANNPLGCILMKWSDLRTDTLRRANNQFSFGLGLQHTVKVVGADLSGAYNLPKTFGGILIVGSPDKPLIDLYQFNVFEIPKPQKKELVV
jgi:hypothetical protein